MEESEIIYCSDRTRRILKALPAHYGLVKNSFARKEVSSQKLLLILGAHEAMRRCHNLLERSGFVCTRLSANTLLSVKQIAYCRALTNLKVSFNAISTELTEITFTVSNNCVGSIHIELLRRQLEKVKSTVDQAA
jgi:hypothetical protein